MKSGYKRDPVSENKLNRQNQNTQKREQRDLGLCLLSSKKGQGLFLTPGSIAGNTESQQSQQVTLRASLESQ